MKHWYVITGGPSSGITATTDYLATLGYHTVPEAARVVIDTGIARGMTVGQMRRDELAFQDTVLKMKHDIESRAPRDKTVFFQRGIPDTLAYYRFIGEDTGKVFDECARFRYSKVFILEPLPYRQDYARVEGEENARRLFELLKETYRELGMDVVVIPKATIEERAEMILGEIKKA